jgi:hypothetical protein
LERKWAKAIIPERYHTGNLALHASATKPDGKSTGSTTLLARVESWAESTDDISLIAPCPLEAFREEAQKKRSWEAAPYGAAQESVHVDDFIAAQRSGTKVQWGDRKDGEA